MIDCIGFDLDNTLYDQRQHIMNVAESAGDWLCRDAGAESDHVRRVILEAWDTLGPTYPKLFDDVLKRLGLLTKERIDAFVRLYHSCVEPLTTYPGIKQLLNCLANKKPLFLLSDGNAQMQRRKLESLGIVPFFEVIVFTAEYGVKKPSLESFRLVVEQFGFRAQCMLYVGDNPACDIAGASAVGMKTARVLTGPFRYVPCNEYKATYTLSNILELEHLVAS
jgi:HAD superfamily hydrolase (TIGR01549 family)